MNALPRQPVPVVPLQQRRNTSSPRKKKPETSDNLEHEINDVPAQMRRNMNAITYISIKKSRLILHTHRPTAGNSNCSPRLIFMSNLLCAHRQELYNHSVRDLPHLFYESYNMPNDLSFSLMPITQLPHDFTVENNKIMICFLHHVYLSSDSIGQTAWDGVAGVGPTASSFCAGPMLSVFQDANHASRVGPAGLIWRQGTPPQMTIVITCRIMAHYAFIQTNQPP